VSYVSLQKCRPSRCEKSIVVGGITPAVVVETGAVELVVDRGMGREAHVEPKMRTTGRYA
jgi:hypothetical protein